MIHALVVDEESKRRDVTVSAIQAIFGQDVTIDERLWGDITDGMQSFVSRYRSCTAPHYQKLIVATNIKGVTNGFALAIQRCLPHATIIVTTCWEYVNFEQEGIDADLDVTKVHHIYCPSRRRPGTHLTHREKIEEVLRDTGLLRDSREHRHPVMALEFSN